MGEPLLAPADSLQWIGKHKWTNREKNQMK